MKNVLENCFGILLICFLFSNCEADEKYYEKERKKILNSYVDLIKRGYVDSGIIELEEFLVMFPENDEAHSLLGQAYFKKGNDSLAIEQYETAIKLNRGNKGAWLGLAVLLDKNGYYVKATDYYQMALAIDSNFYVALSNYVGNCLKNERYKEAVKIGERAVRLGKQKDSDIAILCYSYHMAGYLHQRDSLYSLLLERGYENIEALSKKIHSKHNEKSP